MWLARWLSCLSLLWGVTLAAAEPLPRRDLGGFSLQLPATVAQQAGGIDSKAGRLHGDGLLIDYDLGLYSDPLLNRDGVSGYEEKPVLVDGRPARLVRWRQQDSKRYFIGLHLPELRVTPMGPIRLTLLAQTSDATRLDDIQALLLSLRLTKH
ncbi:hypothetical protein [Roseateles cavernae]|uniref:hypothetical protein n=1 Tax=Roseateles cavernae TaxID=3153578 RepID=UPI0032E43101